MGDGYGCLRRITSKVRWFVRYSSRNGYGEAHSRRIGAQVGPFVWKFGSAAECGRRVRSDSARREVGTEVAHREIVRESGKKLWQSSIGMSIFRVHRDQTFCAEWPVGPKLNLDVMEEVV
jgi:hypothetical protein